MDKNDINVHKCKIYYIQLKNVCSYDRLSVRGKYISNGYVYLMESEKEKKFMNGMNIIQQEMLEEMEKMSGMLQYMIKRMDDMQREMQTLKKENEELKLNIIYMNPMYSNEQRNMAAQQLIEKQEGKKIGLNSFIE